MDAADNGGQQPAETANSTTSAPKPTGAAPARIELTRAVSLAQTGPRGTLMSFSVEYEFVSGDPSPAAQYVWAIKPAVGQTEKINVQLKPQGTLQTLVETMRPEHGPFDVWIEEIRADGAKHNLSDLTPVD